MDRDFQSIKIHWKLKGFKDYLMYNTTYIYSLYYKPFLVTFWRLFTNNKHI